MSGSGEISGYVGRSGVGRPGHLASVSKIQGAMTGPDTQAEIGMPDGRNMGDCGRRHGLADTGHVLALPTLSGPTSDPKAALPVSPARAPGC